MESLVRGVAANIALAVELGAAILIAIGAIQAFALSVPRMLGRPHVAGTRRLAWRQFATWLLLALEFELAADIVRSAIAPSWTDIGQLASIAVIRTFLNFFLERDLDAVLPATRKPDPT